MQMAIDVAGFTPGEADQLRQAMGSKRSRERMEQLRQRLYDGMAERGITGDVAEEIFEKLAAFANYGFPESHSVSFAYLVYASAWIKHHEPAAFCAALLNAQPMGFYSPHSLVQDARRHGVEVRTPDLNASAAKSHARAVRRRRPGAWPCASGSAPCAPSATTWPRPSPPAGPTPTSRTSCAGCPPSASCTSRRWPRRGRSSCFGLERREALWAVGAVAQSRPGRLAGIVTGAERADAAGHVRARGGGGRPVGHRRVARRPSHPLRPPSARPAGRGARRPVCSACDDGTRVAVAGVVTHRQRPATAQGITFINLEDETGLINVVCSKGCWARYRRVARGAPALLVRGRLEKVEGVINVVAERIELLPIERTLPSRDFR